jgi:alpha-tubulin suppressor-like RCC1 family protein
VACGQLHTATIKADGSLWTWGWNNRGQLGLGDYGANAGRLVPTRVDEDADWESVAAGDSHNVAIKTDGSLWAWGFNQYGQCGLGYVTPVLVTAPQRVGGENDWTSVSAGYDWSLAIKSDGSLWVWGRNLEGYLGLGDSGDETNRNVPTRLGAANDWAAVACGFSHSVAIKADGSLWAWGANWGGQLGDGTYDQKESPVQVGTGYAGAAVAGGGCHTLAVKGDGSLWAWGNNESGEVGDGTREQRNAPVRIGTTNDWAVVAPGYDWSLALKTDGSLWTWGYGADGQMGDGVYHFSAILEPVRVDTGYRVPGN